MLNTKKIKPEIKINLLVQGQNQMLDDKDYIINQIIVGKNDKKN
jgi:hypothetical protein